MNEYSFDILIADDSATIRNYMSKLIRESLPKIRIIPAINGKEAVNKVFSETVDLILMDVVMPDMDGFAAARKIRSDPATRNIPIIFITGQDPNLEKMETGLEFGGIDYLSKKEIDRDLIRLLKLYFRFIIRERHINRELEASNIRMKKEYLEKRKLLKQHQLHLRHMEKMARIDQIIRRSSDLKLMIRKILEALYSFFDCDRIWLINPCSPESEFWSIEFEIHNPDYVSELFKVDKIKTTPFMAEHFRTMSASEDIIVFGDETQFINSEFAEKMQIQTKLSLCIYPKHSLPWLLELHQCSYMRVWHSDEIKLFKDTAGRLRDALSNFFLSENIHLSEKRFQRAVINMPVMVVAFDEEFHIKIWNQECQRVSGYGDDMIVGNPWALEILFPDPEYRENILAEIGEKNNMVRNFQLRVVCADEKIRTIELSTIEGMMPLPGWAVWFIGKDVTEKIQAEVEVRNYRHHLEDLVKERTFEMTNAINRLQREIAEKRLTEMALRLSEEKYRLIVENQTDLLVKLDKFGRIIFTSPSFLSVTRQKERDILGSLLADWIYPEDKELMNRTLNSLVNEKQQAYCEFRTGNKDNILFWGWQFTPITEDLIVEGIVAVGRDITQRIRAEQNLIESQSKLKEANATKDKFFSIIAHDLKNPFNSMLSSTDVILRQYDAFSKDEIKIFLENINSDAKKSFNLLQDLLQWARSQTGRIRINITDIDIARIVLESRDIHRVSARTKEIDINIDIPDNLWIKGDINMISTIFGNLISNAVKFTPKKGKITISSERTENKAKIRITDTGIGISRDNIRKLFRIDTAYTTPGTNDETGTGLGLILCKEFLDKNNGTISVESEPGFGSSFIITLPLSDITDADEEMT